MGDQLLWDRLEGESEPAADGRRPSRRKRVLVVCVVALVLLAVCAGAGVWAVQARLAGNVEHFGDPFEALPSRPPAAVAPPGTSGEAADQAPLNVLVLGSDSRISAGDPARWEAGAQRTDAILLVHLPADGASAQVMSIPRDSWVDIHGHGSAKINAAFALGGPSLMIQTVEALTAVRIDHVAVADFSSFTRLTDALGGGGLTLQEPLYDRGRFVAPAGQQLLSGEQALIYVRQRKNLARGDFDRVQRQQAWMRAIVARVRNEGTLKNPLEAVPFLDAVTESISADDGLTKDVLQDLAARASGLASDDLTFLTVPVDGIGRSPDGAQSIVRLDRPALDALMAAVRADDVVGYLEQQPGEVDVLPPVAP